MQPTKTLSVFAAEAVAVIAYAHTSPGRRPVLSNFQDLPASATAVWQIPGPDTTAIEVKDTVCAGPVEVKAEPLSVEKYAASATTGISSNPSASIAPLLRGLSGFHQKLVRS